MKIIGLTGGAASGKTTLSTYLKEKGIPVFSADAAVAEILANDPRALLGIKEILPEAVTNEGIEKKLLATAVFADAEKLKQLEDLLHPLVAERRQDWLKKQTAPLVLLEIPLLFETGMEAQCDEVITTTLPLTLQRERILARPGMTKERLDAMLKRQWSDEARRAKAHHVVDTSLPLHKTLAQLEIILHKG